MQKNPTSALLIIGNEILSGRTLDLNTQHIATTLGSVGIDLLEVRVVPDTETEIIDAVNFLRKKYMYVFTTGGIGPTHDDITSEAIAKAFGLKYVLHPEAFDILLKHYGGSQNLNDGRTKMAYMPEGAKLIANLVSAAPGFVVENVYVMAGVPKIMQAMLEAIIHTLKTGQVVVSKTINIKIAESKIATILSDVQKKYMAVSIGSYPYMKGDEYKDGGVNIVLRCTDNLLLEKACAELLAIFKNLNYITHEE